MSQVAGAQLGDSQEPVDQRALGIALVEDRTDSCIRSPFRAAAAEGLAAVLLEQVDSAVKTILVEGVVGGLGNLAVVVHEDVFERQEPESAIDVE